MNCKGACAFFRNFLRVKSALPRRPISRSSVDEVLISPVLRSSYPTHCIAPVEYHLIGPRLIHALGSLCTTTTCRPLPRRLSGLRSHPRGSRSTLYARSCKRTSQNTPSTHSGE